MQNNKFLNTLGLCARSGSCLFGESACLGGIRAEKVFLMFVDALASDNTKKRFRDACSFRNVPLVFYQSNECDIANAVGKPSGKLFAIANRSWSQAIEKHAELNYLRENQGGAFHE